MELLGYILRFNSGVKNGVLFDIPKSFERYSKSYLDIDNATIRRLNKQVNKRGIEFKVRNVFVMNSAENFIEMEMPVGVDILTKNKDGKFKHKVAPTVLITGSDDNRDKNIYNLYKKGYPTELMAVLFRKSRQQIYNIVKKYKKYGIN